jgi:hypothetical protein
MGQPVTVFYQAEQHTLTIENNSGKEIVLFSNGVNKDYDNVFEPNAFKKMAEPSGVTFSDYFMMLRNGYTHTFEFVNPIPEKIVYFDYEIISYQYVLTRKKEILTGYKNETYNVSNEVKTDTAEVTQTNSDTTQKTPLAEPEKPVKKPTVKKTPPPPVENPYRTQIEKLFNDSKENLAKGKGGLLQNEEEQLRKIEKKAVTLHEKIEKDKLALEKKKANKKVKCDDCEELIKFAKESLNQIDFLTGKIHILLANMTDDEIAEMKLAYWNEVLFTAPQDTITIRFVKAEIERRNKHYLWGWVGKTKIMNQLNEVAEHYELIKEKSAIFIQQKLTYYSDDYDRAVINDLDKEIPNGFNDIEECENELNSITIPYTTLSLIGIVFLLLMVGIVVYIRSIVARKKLKKVEIENKMAGKSGLVIEEDEPFEAVSYRVGLNDIKEKTGIDYYAIDMDEILEDTTIKEVFLSRQVILDIYNFFANFVKHDKTNETGCFLVGRWGYVSGSNNQRYDISIENVVAPSDDAVYGEYNLNFGAKIGITLNFAIEKLCEKTGNEYVHTAWMHSHPGLGLFLSSQDLSVQSQLAHSQHFGRLLAIVLDSNTPDLKMAFFTPKHNGTMNNDKDVKRFLSLEELHSWAEDN